jgi:hypothetical protein
MLECKSILLKRFASGGDAEAFAEIVQQRAPLVYDACLRILEDTDRAAYLGLCQYADHKRKLLKDVNKEN